MGGSQFVRARDRVCLSDKHDVSACVRECVRARERVYAHPSFRLARGRRVRACVRGVAVGGVAWVVKVVSEWLGWCGVCVWRGWVGGVGSEPPEGFRSRPALEASSGSRRKGSR